MLSCTSNYSVEGMATSQCYHPNITAPEAEHLLLEKGFHGSFLTRPSQSTPGNYSLSVRREDCILHVRIQNQGEYYDLYAGEKSATLTELIEFYVEHPGELKEKDATIIDLIQPLYCEDVATTERWYHSGIDGKTAEQLLLSRGHPGSYLVRMSMRNPGSFVLSVLVEDEVTHIMINSVNDKFVVGQGKRPFNSLSNLVEYHLQYPLNDSYNRPVLLGRPFISTSFLPSFISHRIAELEKPNGFAYGKSGFFEEFEGLQKKELASMCSRREGMKPVNRAKNRFKNITPYDHSMVVLKDPPTPGETYINANYLSGEVPHSENCYIATQGCLPNTINDFWHMVWQERSQVIVMITKEIERSRNKCFRYWPSSGEVVAFGKVNVKLTTEENINPHLICRNLVASCHGEERSVYQYQFKGWPEHGVPDDPAIFLSFMEEVNHRTKGLNNAATHSGPTVVHCSAGIGRTGTYIIIDVLIKLIEYQGWEDEIDIQRSIQKLREFRSGMVQTDLQYKMTYQVIQYYIKASQRCMQARTTGEELVYDNVDLLPLTASPRHRASRGAGVVSRQSPKLPPKPKMK